MKACIDRVLDRSQQAESVERAVAENPLNAPLPQLVEDPSRQELVLLTGSKWQNGRTLRVRFLDGDPRVQAKVQHYAQEWSQHAHLQLVFGSDPPLRSASPSRRGDPGPTLGPMPSRWPAISPP